MGTAWAGAVGAEPAHVKLEVKQEPEEEVKPVIAKPEGKLVKEPEGKSNHVCKETLCIPSLTEEKALCSECNLEAKLESLRKVREINTADLPEENLNEWKKRALRVIPFLTHLKVPVEVEKSDNPDFRVLQPTESDIIMLESIAPDLCQLLRKCSLEQFLKILSPKVRFPRSGEHLKGTLFEIYDEAAKNYTNYENQKRRAAKLVREMKARDLKKLYLLDGHGRTLLSILRAMKDKEMDLSEMSIVVVDIDKQCDSFHKHFFPGKIETKCMNIFDVEVTETDMVYLNFCSIPSRTCDPIHNKEEVLKKIWEWMKTLKGIMISAAIRDNLSKDKGTTGDDDTIKGPRGKDYHLTVRGFQTLLISKELFAAEEPIVRNEGAANEFKTWFISSKTCKAPTNPYALEDWFEEEQITWDYRTDIREGVYISAESGKYKNNPPVKVTKRTPCRAYFGKNNECYIDITKVKFPVQRKLNFDDE